MLTLKSCNWFFLVISVLVIAGCTKGGYQDINGHYFYRSSDGQMYYKNSSGAYVHVDSPGAKVNNLQVSANDELAQRVMAVLQTNEDLKKQDIKVSSLDGQVELNGYVEHNSDRLEAIKLARNVPGVKLVVDKLSVKLFSFM